ncbi:MAG: phage baseplate assembly protein V [Deltaproteobacteria bacterium]|jgi:uncharacterized protein involved in type VI secretion and phage assembly|nr:phage baseplate assembly protein V [Deltaproteobacteria bacterium]
MSDTQTEMAFGLDSVPELAFHVLAVSGAARLNGLYRFGVRALALSRDLASAGPEDFLYGTATLRLRGPGQPGAVAPGGCPARAGDWHGVVTSVSLGAGIGDFATVDLALEPSMSRLRGQIQSRIHMDATSPEIVRESMLFGGMDPGGVRLDLLDPGAYPSREFVMQHGEDLLRFVMRTLEREGITLRFDQSGGTDVAVLTDSCSRFPSLTDGGSEAELDVSGVSGLGPGDVPALFGARLASRLPRRTVRLRDYDWMRPGRPVEAELEISPSGRGEIYLYGENFRTEAEGRRLAAVIRDAELWDCESLSGMTHLAGIMPGLTLGVRGSRQATCDGRWAVRSASVTGSQAGRVAAALGLDPGSLSGLPGKSVAGGMPGTAGAGVLPGMAGAGAAGMPGPAGPVGGGRASGGQQAPWGLRAKSPSGEASRARGEAADGLAVRVALGRAELACCPARLTPRPPAAAPVAAWIDGSGTAGEPEMDEFGSYRVLFPFDLSGRANGKASPWIRLARPGVGSGYGQHFPLTPGCEVQVSFTEGDPDRPVITGAVADAATGSLTGAASSFFSGIGTRGGSALLFGEKPDSQSVTLSGGSGRGTLTLAAGSPTTAEVVADVSSQLSGSLKQLAFFGSTNSSGGLFSVRAESGWVRGIIMIMTALREAAGIVSDWTAFKRDKDEKEDKTKEEIEKLKQDPDPDQGQAKSDALTLASNASAWASYFAGPLQPLMQWICEARQRKKSPPVDWRGYCDVGIFSLRGSPEGSKAVWRTTEPTTAVKLAGPFTFVKTLREGPRKAVEILEGDQKEKDQAQKKMELDAEASRLDNEAKIEEGKNSQTEEAKKARDKATRAWNRANRAAPKSATAKASNRAVRIGSAVGKTLADTLVSAHLLLTLAGKVDGRARGLHVLNSDSYVAVTAQTHASFSAKGPLLLESGGAARLGEDLRYPHVRGDARLSALLAGEDGTGPAYWEGASAVLLRGELVRTFAETLCLGATGRVDVKSPQRIRVATGENRTVARQGKLFAMESVESDLLVKLDKGPEGFARGVSLEVLQGEGVARMCCLEPSGAVQLLLGSHRGDNAKTGKGFRGGSRLELSSDGVHLQDGNERTLTFSGAAGAALKNGKNLSLVLEGGKATMKAEENDGKKAELVLGVGSLKVTASDAVKIEGAGGNKITIDGTEFVAAASKGKVEIKSKILA